MVVSKLFVSIRGNITLLLSHGEKPARRWADVHASSGKPNTKKNNLRFWTFGDENSGSAFYLRSLEEKGRDSNPGHRHSAPAKPEMSFPAARRMTEALRMGINQTCRGHAQVMPNTSSAGARGHRRRGGTKNPWTTHRCEEQWSRLGSNATYGKVSSVRGRCSLLPGICII